MPLKVSPQRSMFDPQTISPGLLEPGSVPWLLTRLRRELPLVPAFLSAEWRGAGTLGREAWPADVLFALFVLRWCDGGSSRLGACRRARTDLAWRAAMGLSAGGSAPTEKTMREFEQWLMQRSPSCDRVRYDVLFDCIALLAAGDASARMWMMDGTPMFCFGALRGTVRLLGDGLRGLLRRVSRARKTTLARVAAELDVLWTTAKSTKGGLNVDWRDAQARYEVVDRLARDVLRVVEHVVEGLSELPPRHHQAIRQRCEALLKVITDDLVTDEAGRLVVVRRRTSDRIVSITDPEARSGRKSRSQTFKGFKLNVFGDILSGLITGVQVFPGNQGEGGPGVKLLARAKQVGLRIEQVLADCAYGGTSDRLNARALEIDLLSPPRAIRAKAPEVVRKHQFEIDFDSQRATCPAGQKTSKHSLVRHEGRDCSRFEWSYETCRSCPLRQRCVPKMPDVPKRRGRAKGKRLTLHADEQELRAAREVWEDPARRLAYRRRGEGETLVARMIRYGARQARAFGLEAANLQVHAVAMAANLALLARRLMLQDTPLPHPTLPLFPDTT